MLKKKKKKKDGTGPGGSSRRGMLPPWEANRRTMSRTPVCLPLLLVGVSGNIPLFPLASHLPDFGENPAHLPCFSGTSEGKVL